ncbi:hypothetical protein ACFVFS_32550 [Kitasatospora sp. NPDC057692]|uniref:hypothetical protein n=1 Tax=Kitasatospora sp. NPDC057692 TaxID=3346215 RepID=UPI0036CF8CEC
MRKIAATGAVGAALVLGLATAPAQAAQPAPPSWSPQSLAALCPWTGIDLVTAEGTIVKDQAAVHNGPAASCKVIGHRPLYSGVEILCKYVNSSGNLWYATTIGWIYGPYVRVDKVSDPLPNNGYC